MLIQPNRLLTDDLSPPSDLKPWLNHRTSLTEKLKIYTGEAELRVLNQHWLLPTWWDRFTLGLSAKTVMHRDILMYAQQTPCWYARTIIPDFSYEAHSTFFDRLKHETLGLLVFNESSIERRLLFTYAVNAQCLEYHWLSRFFTEQSDSFWLRFSVFVIANSSPFYLVEILLPGLMSVIN